jgi:hypothetical protein
LLTDSQGGTRQYSVFVTITAGDIELKIFATDEDWAPGPAVPVAKQHVSAHIKSITNSGLMTIKFNETMFTSMNHAIFNESSVPIFIVPALKRQEDESFRQSQVALNWTLKSFVRDTMLIQLKFHKVYHISPLIVQDKVHVNFTKVASQLYSGN